MKPEKQEITRDEEGKFVKGTSGNPDGRPTFSLISILKEELQKCPEGQDKKTHAFLLIRRMLKEAIENGNDQQIKNILQYVEGMPTQRIEGDIDIKQSLVEFIDGKSKD